jgi:hypothetical protein
MVPTDWLTRPCPHGRAGLKFVEESAAPSDEPQLDESEPAMLGETDFEYTSMDATKNIGYPVREHGPYGSHPVRDDFDDESDADGPGKYPGVR